MGTRPLFSPTRAAVPTAIDGKAIAASIRSSLAQEVGALHSAIGLVPGLAVVIVGNDPASQIYVARKVELTREIGMRSFEYRFAADVAEHELVALVATLNIDPAVNGILVQLPLPAHIDAGRILSTIDPGKDVDGFHPINAGRLLTGEGGLVPCTALAVILLLEAVITKFAGLSALVIGRSNIVGKPAALLLLERGCTVTIAHSKSLALPELVGGADIVVAAVGKAALVKPQWIKPGAVVVDVGINRVPVDGGKSRVIGDVAEPQQSRARAFTPVPGGVGPMTIACLLSNTLRAFRAAKSLAPPTSA